MARRACEQHETGRGLFWPGLVASEVGDATGDPVAAMDGGNSRKGSSELVIQQGKMSAGEDDRVDPIAPGLVEQRPRGRSDGFGADFLAAELCFCKFDQLGRPVADDYAISRELGGEIINIRLSHGRLGAKYSDHATHRDFGGRFDRRHSADDWQV